MATEETKTAPVDAPAKPAEPAAVAVPQQAPATVEATPPVVPAPNLLGDAFTAPQEIEIVVPDGMSIDPSILASFKDAAKAAGLSAKQAQSQFDLYSSLQRDAISKYQEQLKGVEAQRLEALKADPEFGGQKFQANTVLAQKAMVRFGTPELANELKALGLGNHPGLMKVLAKVGRAISEDKTTRPPQGPSTEALSQEDALRQRFPSMYPTMES